MQRVVFVERGEIGIDARGLDAMAEVTMSSRVFCVLFVSARLAARGDSMPTKIVVKCACFMRRRSS